MIFFNAFTEIVYEYEECEEVINAFIGFNICITLISVLSIFSHFFENMYLQIMNSYVKCYNRLTGISLW